MPLASLYAKGPIFPAESKNYAEHSIERIVQNIEDLCTASGELVRRLKSFPSFAPTSIGELIPDQARSDCSPASSLAAFTLKKQNRRYAKLMNEREI